MKGPFRADQVGSLLRPPELKEARERRKKNEISAEELRALEDKLIRVAVAKQEECGLEAITDGDFRRNSWSGDFLSAIPGIVQAMPAGHQQQEHTPVGGVVRNWQPPTPRTVAKLRFSSTSRALASSSPALRATSSSTAASPMFFPSTKYALKSASWIFAPPGCVSAHLPSSCARRLLKVMRRSP